MPRSQLPLLIAFFCLLGPTSACEQKSQPSPGRTSTKDASGAHPVFPKQDPSSRPSVGPPPEDLDINAVKKKLRCPRPGRHACRILDDFSGADAWDWRKLSREARWVGNAFVVDDRPERKEAWVLWAAPVPTAQVDPGLLPLKVAAGVLSKGLGHERWKVIDAISRLASVSKRNRALVAASRFAPTTPHPTQRTTGKSLMWLAEDKTYVRQEGRRLLVVKLSSAPTAAPGQGTYAELWPVFW